MPAPKPKPLDKFAKAVAGCSIEAAAYGRCVVEDYNALYKDKCLKQFLKLKTCYQAAFKKS